MNKTEHPQWVVAQSGFWSAALVTFLTVLFFASLVFPNKNLMHASSFVLAPAFFAMMVSIHYYAPPEKKVWSHLGIWLFILNGVLFIIPTLLVLVFPLPVNETGTGLGDKVGVYANLIWSAYFAVTAGLVTVLFKRLAFGWRDSNSLSG